MMSIKLKYKEENKFAENWEEWSSPLKENIHAESIK